MKVDFYKDDEVRIIDKDSHHYGKTGTIETLSINNPFALVRLSDGKLVKLQFIQMDEYKKNQ